jgi:KDO2-lipid IV(A) lauroyltransferase
LSERLLRALMRVLAALPLRLAHGIGAFVGTLIALFPNRQRRNALINIALCLPDLSAVEQRRLRNRNLRAFGKTYCEISHFWLHPQDRVMGLVREVRGGELLRRTAGKGLIVLSPHLGAWELAGLYLSAQGPTAIFYKPQRHFDDLIVTARARGGATLAPITAKGIRLLIQSLARGDYVGILPDQEPRGDKGAVFAPFFGVPAFTMLLVNRLARRSGARVVFMFAERLPRGRGYRMHCIEAPDGVDSEDDQTAAAALNQGIARCVMTCPDQYLWPYRRFRRRPEGDRKVYTGGLGDFQALEHARRLRSGAAAVWPSRRTDS